MLQCNHSYLLIYFPPLNFFLSEMLWPENLRSVVRNVIDADWKQLYPLREDVNLQLFQPLAEIHANINFDKQFKLNEKQEVSKNNLYVGPCGVGRMKM